MFADVLVLTGEGDGVGRRAAFEVAQVQVTELFEANESGLPAPNTSQLMKPETATVGDGELISTI